MGTPIQGYDDESSLIWQREIDNYGNAKMQVGKAGFCNYQYQGQTLDTETGLAYNRFRYYASEAGMYISQDPIRLAGNNPTLYRYIIDPNSWLDVFGLDCIKNKTDGTAREKKAQKKLEGLFGEQNVLRERTLRDASGTKLVGRPNWSKS